ncbi:MAG: hypothetical protein ACU833_14370 [Gammaproteobacteria bacterium]
MFNFKKILLAVWIACSMGAISVYSTTAVAEGLRANKDVIEDVLKSLNEAMSAIENSEPKDTILEHILSARQFSKEMNIGSLGAITERGAGAIVNSLRNVKKDDLEAARVSINSAIEEYTEMSKITL